MYTDKNEAPNAKKQKGNCGKNKILMENLAHFSYPQNEGKKKRK